MSALYQQQTRIRWARNKLRAHTNMDPDPKAVVAAYPTVVDWAERRADSWDGSGELAPFGAPTAFARHVLGEIDALQVADPVLIDHRVRY